MDGFYKDLSCLAFEKLTVMAVQFLDWTNVKSEIRHTEKKKHCFC